LVAGTLLDEAVFSAEPRKGLGAFAVAGEDFFWVLLTAVTGSFSLRLLLTTGNGGGSLGRTSPPALAG
jgi:hypothetical protein